MEGDVAKDKEKGVFVSKKIREKYGQCSSFLTGAMPTDTNNSE